MAFSITHYEENGFSVIALKDGAGTSISVIPAFGALLHAFEIDHQGGRLNVIDSYASAEAFRAEVTESFKGVKLSPFACRIKDAAYNWQQHDLRIRKSPIHGLLYDQTFDVIREEADTTQALIALQHHYKGTDPGYPFPYTCHVQYRLLAGSTLEVTTTITNHHDHTIPVMDGWHPYFATGTEVDRLELQFYSKEIVEFDRQLIPTGQVLPYREFEQTRSMAGVELDNSFLLDFNQPAPLCTLHDPVKGVRVEFYPDEKYPVLQVYTPPHRRSIAIENLTGAPDAFNNGIGLVKVPAAQSVDFTTTIRVKNAH